MSWEPSSWTAARPSRTAGMPPGSPPVSVAPTRESAEGSAPASTSSDTSARPGRATSETRGGALSLASRAARSASTVSAVEAWWPSSAARIALTIHSGWDCSTARRAVGVAVPGMTTASQSSRDRSLMRRITALTKPAAPAPLTLRASPTVSSTAAWVATRIPSSWWAPSRSVSSTLASICDRGRPAASAMIGS